MVIFGSLASHIPGWNWVRWKSVRRRPSNGSRGGSKTAQKSPLTKEVTSAFGRFRAWLPSRHSLNAKIIFVGIIFSLVPVIAYHRLDQADREKAELLLDSAKEQGRLILLHLKPLLQKGLKKLPEIEKALKSVSDQNLNVRVLFQPKPPAGSAGIYYGEFFYVAASPGLTERYLKSEIRTLRQQGILSRLLPSCNRNETIGMRHPGDNGEDQLITAIIPLQTQSGCWLIVTSYPGNEVALSLLSRPYWQAPELRFASAMYFIAAAVSILVLVRIRMGLRTFRDTAVAIGRNIGGSTFAERNIDPDLNGVAIEFDRMVQRLGLLSFAIERSPTAISIADRSWRLEYVNSAYEALSGKHKDELIGVDFRYKDFESVSDLSWVEICEQVENGFTWHGEIRRRKPDGRFLWANVSLYKVIEAGGESEHFVCMQEDVSERKKILDNLVAEKHKAETLNQVKSNFVARLSHEFRTPLNAIMGFSEVISIEAFGKCDVPKYLEYAENIHSSGSHLLSLINDILDLSKLESGKVVLHPEAFDLTALIQEVLTLHGSDAGKGKVTLTHLDGQDTMYMVADHRAVKQILINLVSNAVKFTPEGGAVTVRSEVCEESRIMLTVSDTGCGIEKHELPRLFEPYERSERAYVRDRSGTGLGLPIVKRLVELQHGELEITSEVGSGTEVKVMFPCAS